jgi:HYR domain
LVLAPASTAYTCANVGANNITLTVTDAAGNTGTCVATVTVRDATAPTITVCPANVTVNDCDDVVPSMTGQLTATDNCGGLASVTQNPVAGSSFGQVSGNSVVVTFYATDNNGNVRTCSNTVTIGDNIAPTFTNCPASITVGNDVDKCGANVTLLSPSAADNCSAVVVTRTAGLATGAFFPLGTTTQTYTATDASGNTATCNFTVTVTEVQKPTAVCQNITVNLSTTGAVTVTSAQINGGSTDNCTAANALVLAPASTAYTCANVGANNITLTATDAAGNTGTCVATVTVRDATAPTITTCPANVTVNNCSDVVPSLTGQLTATDNCGGLASVTQNPVAGSSFGQVSGNSVVVTFYATDNNGNVRICSNTVTIGDNIAPTFTNCPASITVGNDVDKCGANVTLLSPSAADNCSGVVVTRTAGLATGAFFPLGTTTQTYTATDASGNTATCNFTVTVTEVQKPTAVCQNITVNLSNAGTVTVTSAQINGGSTDNCTAANALVLAPASTTYTCANVGVNNIALTVTDAAGNTGVCVATVTVRDATAPTITNCPAPVTVPSCNALVPNVVAGLVANDACGIASITQSPAAGLDFGFANGNSVTITVTVTDAHGNVTSCSVPVTIQDAQAPVYQNCPTVMTMIGNDGDQCSAKINWALPVALDDCQLVSNVQVSGPIPGTVLAITCPSTPSTIVYRATDASGNTSTCSFQVMVVDLQKPAFNADITMPTNISVECNAVPTNCVFHGNGLCTPLTVSDLHDNCAGPLTVSFNEVSTKGTDPNACNYYSYTLTRTWTATDCAGNARQHTQVITVRDTTKPVAVCKNITITLNDFGTFTIASRDLDGGSTDNCAANANLTFTASQTVFTCADFGVSPVSVILTVADPCGNFSTCAALVTILQGKGDCSPQYDAMGSDPCVCLDNATTLTDGQFGELVQIHGSAGQTWTLVSSAGLYLSTSPAPPFQPIAMPNGTVLTNGQVDGIDNDGDGLTDELDERVYYTLKGRHVDGIGYAAQIKSNLNQEITVAGKCYYPTPFFTSFATNDVFCLGTPAFPIQVGEQYNAVGTVVPGSLMVDGVSTTTFNPATLGIGNHTVMATFDAGAAQSFVTINGVVASGSDAAALADPGCKQKISQIVKVVATPATLVCNDLVFISLAADCYVAVNADDVLEGTYYCYDDYRVLIDRTFPYGNGPWVSAIFNAADIGKTFDYRVVHSSAGGSNLCAGQLKVEDKMSPVLVCPADITISCSEPSEVGNTGNVGVTDCSNFTTAITNNYTDFGQCNSPRGQIVRNWVVTDVWGNQSSCSHTITITPFDLNAVIFPADLTVNCESAYLNGAATGPDNTGNPTINGFPIGQGGMCTASIHYTDERYKTCEGSYEILRTWKVRNTCLAVSDDNPVTHVQVITVADLGGPVFVCPAAVTVSTDALTCCSTSALPDMLISEGCSHVTELEASLTGTNPNNGNVITFTVPGHLGDFAGNNYWNPDTLAIFGYTQCMPLGTYSVRYKASDECGNTSYCSFELTVADLVPPIASCDQTTTVAIGTDDLSDCYTPANGCVGAGVTWVDATTFDDGSSDKCHDVKLTVRRMAPYSDAITNLNHTPCYPSGASEFDVATAESDSIKFYCTEVGTTQTVILRVYQIDYNGDFVPGIDGTPLFNECMVQVEVQDKIKPICQAPANVTATCEQFDPSLWLYGKANVVDNCSLDETKVFQGQCGLTHAANYVQFDSVCNKGTIIRTFRAFDAHGNSSQCTQRVVVTYEQDYYVKFPNDVIVTTCDGTGIYGEPTFFGEDCELLGVSHEDQIFTVVPDACFKIERNWKIINWCTFNPNANCINVPNPTPNAIANHPTNLPGPIVSPIQTAGDPWKSTIVKINATDANTTNYSTFYDANANCYTYKQIIKIIDTQDPIVECPVSPATICDITTNDAALWNQSYWWDNTNQTHDLNDAPSDICITATDACSGANINIEYQLFLDLDGDGTMETVVNSTQLGAQPGGLGWNNVLFGSATGAGISRQFDARPVPTNQKWGFAIQETVTGNNKTACVKFNTFLSQSNYATPQLPYGTHKIKWFVTDGCGNETICEYSIIVKDCKAPTVVCLNGLSVNIMPTGMIQMWATDFLQYAEDNYTQTQYLKYAIRKCGQGAGFPVDGNNNPITNVTFNCSELGTQCVELWAIDLAGNADYCETYIIVQDNAGNCAVGSTVNVSGALKTAGADGIEEGNVNITGSVNFAPPFSYFGMTNNAGIYSVSNAVPVASSMTITPVKDDNPLNGVTTYDLVLISKHILGVQPLGSPYKMIAADANKSNSITTFDIVELRKLVLGVYQELPNNTSWRFVEKSHTFANAANPFQGTIPENISVADAMTHQMGEDFVGVKIGDVNNTAVANSLMELNDRSNGTLLFDVNDRDVKAGEAVEVSFTAAEKTQGYQMTLNLNGLMVTEIMGSDRVTSNNFGVFTDALTVSVDGSDVFTVKFRATKSGKLSEMLSVSSRITKAEGYNLTDGRMEVALRFDGKTIAGVGFELYQNQPNPFVNKTAIGFHLPEATTATLTVYDETGRVVFTQKGDFAKGYNAISLDRALLNTTGVLYYTLETATDSATKKMIQVK